MSDDTNYKSMQYREGTGDSDSEFYDAEAYETTETKRDAHGEKEYEVGVERSLPNIDNLYTFSDDDDDFRTMNTEFKDFESKKFLDRHENLTKLNDGETEKESGDKFVPLHEKLNKEAEAGKVAKDESSDDDEADDDVKINDPFFVDEEALKEEQANLTEAEREEKLKEAQGYKAAGNQLFGEQKYTEALEEYTKALRTCPVENFNKERAVFYSNRSICYFKLKEDLKCVVECTRSLELNPDFVKPLLRRAECNQTLDKLDEVLADYKRLCELEPSNRGYKRKCFELEESIRERNEKMKEEMMGKLKELGNMCLKPFGLSTNNFNFVQDPATGSYSVNFNQN